jgi:hypothetical protein
MYRKPRSPRQIKREKERIVRYMCEHVSILAAESCSTLNYVIDVVIQQNWRDAVRQRFVECGCNLSAEMSRKRNCPRRQRNV